ncbi:IscS subfamily cysteine desulfurase [Saprospira sp. CCB-QB6]|uniref:IscS subfamily cysteine desulfurase n=1 Tax=Saprospira sp. CCB-QB6 TaxID=3023936 RepID=UPI002349DFB5|nr:IscS subfamily cysteine desulfurase [Saprospira sp. CCB-QB6]WCL82852.1 IscS subfamily cysteine desulfurase [Saprospira sp. CCB-QB6]
MSDKRLVYLDNSATTPVDPRVLEEMLPYFKDKFGNAASRNHSFGWVAEDAVDQARERIAKLLGADPREIIFTSGATEGVNLAIKGVANMYSRKGNHIITAKTEHKAVLDTCKALERQGIEVTYLDVNRQGLIDLDELRAAIKDTTILVALMFANNEIGTIQPVKEIAKICAENKTLFFSDATQAVGKVPVDVKDMGIHILAFSGHKIYGPKGVGALYVSRKNPRVKLTAQIDGGGHERGMRSGTLNVPAIVGLGKACELAGEEMEAETVRLQALRDKIDHELLQMEEVVLNGAKESRLPQLTNISFKHVEGEGLMMTFNENIALSSGSACTSASLEPSYVLKALGLGDDLAHSSLRISLGRFTTEEDVDYAIERIRDGVNHMRSLSPIWEMYQEGIDLDSVEWSEH